MARDFPNGTTDLLRQGAAAITAYPYTYAAWINGDDFATDGNNVTWVGEAGIDDSSSSFGISTAGKIVLDVYGPGAGYNSILGATTLSTGTWYHICGVWRSTTDREVYLNGTSDGSGSATWPAPNGSYDRTSVGCYDRLSSVSGFDGKIELVSIWNVALSVDEIAALAKRQHPLFVRPNALQRVWDLNGVSAGNETDLVGGHVLTEVGTVGAADSPAVFFRPQPVFVIGGVAAANITGTASGDINSLAAAAVGTHPFTGTATGALNALAAALAGTISSPITGTGSGAINALAAALEGTITGSVVTGTASGAINALAGAAAGTHPYVGVITGALNALRAAATGTGGPTGGGLSQTLAQMRRRERQQLLAMLRKDDDEVLALLLARLRSGD